MVIKKTTNNETIIKQLTELLNNAFDKSLEETINLHNSVRMIKERGNQETVVDEAIRLAKFIGYWLSYTYGNELFHYSLLMRQNDSIQLYRTFHETYYSKFIDHSLFNNSSYTSEKEQSQFFEQTIIPLTIRVKQYNGSMEESLSMIAKTVLVEQLVLVLLHTPGTIVELLSTVNHYNDYNYQLERFISVFEENLLNKKENQNPRINVEEYVNPLELLGVWSLDDSFLKETIIPELKNRALTNEQKQKAAIHSNCKDLVNNYYDYCLYYAYGEDYELITGHLVDTLFFYEKEHYDKAISLINKALLINDELDKEGVQSEYECLLDQTEETKPEWVDSLRLLLKSS